MALVADRTKLIGISLLIMLSVSMFGGIVSEDVSAAGIAGGCPHLEAEYTVNPGSISSIDEAVVVTLNKRYWREGRRPPPPGYFLGGCRE